MDGWNENVAISSSVQTTSTPFTQLRILSPSTHHGYGLLRTLTTLLSDGDGDKKPILRLLSIMISSWAFRLSPYYWLSDYPNSHVLRAARNQTTRGKYRGHVPWLQSSAEPNRVPRTDHPAEIIPSMDKSSRWCQLSPFPTALHFTRSGDGRGGGRGKEKKEEPVQAQHQPTSTRTLYGHDTRTPG